MGDHVAIVTGTPTQVAHSGKAVLRTIVQTLIPVLAFLGAAIPIIIDTVGEHLPESWIAWLVGAAAVVVALSGLIAKLMALGKAQRFWTKIGLGTGVEREDLARQQ